MALYKAGQSSSSTPVGITEFEILKASHKFLREEDDKASSWDEQLAAKYYSSLYREFALCDLKHYKTGNFALRWRTEEEVIDGSGETTCGNTRCEHHFKAPRRNFDGEPDPTVPLTTLELPFAYVEQGENKSALVKVVLCGRCLKKLMWKRTREREKNLTEPSEKVNLSDEKVQQERSREEGSGKEKEKDRRTKRSREETEERLPRKRRHSRSPP